LIIKDNLLLWTGVTRDEGIIIQQLASNKGFTWQNGKKFHNPFIPTYALAFDFDEKLMYFYSIKEARLNLSEGERGKTEIKVILRGLKLK